MSPEDGDLRLSEYDGGAGATCSNSGISYRKKLVTSSTCAQVLSHSMRADRSIVAEGLVDSRPQ